MPEVQKKQKVRMPKRKILGSHLIISTMAKKPMVQKPRPSTKTGNPGGPAGNNPPKPKK